MPENDKRGARPLATGSSPQKQKQKTNNDKDMKATKDGEEEIVVASGPPQWFKDFEERLSLQLTTITPDIADVKKSINKAKDEARLAMETAKGAEDRVEDVEIEIDKLKLTLQDCITEQSFQDEYKGIVAEEVEYVYTFLDPSKVGVITFKRETMKNGFLKNMRTRKVQWTCKENMWFTNNNTYEKRVIDKTLGQVKHLLMNKGYDQKLIRIDWNKEVVKFKGNVIVEVKEEGHLTTYSEGNLVKEEVDSFMQKWKND
ncbi:unnamed protein product, partial [Prorocentrum cordatum]